VKNENVQVTGISKASVTIIYAEDIQGQLVSLTREMERKLTREKCGKDR
jgi:hypothetical protein